MSILQVVTEQICHVYKTNIAPYITYMHFVQTFNGYLKKRLVARKEKHGSH
jgi:hypothetical protein